jgi:EAL domain-containing protein (putative c-di-GMP-specific phosphodiesterase class I)
MSRHASGLNKAVEDFFIRQEFQLDYQPVLSLDRHQIGGFEALLHLRKSRAQQYPVNFIPLIEETSLRTPLARWVLREACQQVQRWQAQHDSPNISVSVNVSPRQLRQGNVLMHQLDHALSETGLQPGSLQLEIPEVVTHHFQSLADTLAGLKNLGIQLYLDNFIPSQKAFEILPHLPVDAVKMCHSSLRTWIRLSISWNPPCILLMI